MNRRRVVITGIGAVTPLGLNFQDTWEALKKGINGIRPVERFMGEEFRTHNGGEVRGFDLKNYVSDLIGRPVGLCSQFGIASAKMALEHSGLKDYSRERIGVSVGTTMGDVQELEFIDAVYFKEGIDKIDSKMMLNYPAHETAKNIARVFELFGPNFTVTTACAAGNYAFGYAYDSIINDKADMMIAGGADVLSQVAYAGFNRLFAMAPEICQPFSLDRKGMIVSEGACFLVLEELEHAKKRKAPILAEFAGYGISCDAFDITIPHENGEGAIEVMNKAIAHSQIDPKDIGYINTHGTGTKENDRVESLAIKQVFKDHAKNLCISSTKSMTGHLMGASSALEGAISVMTLVEGIIPPTINYNEPDPECDLDIVPNKAKEKKVIAVMSNAFAFGGNNASIILKKYQDA